MPLTSKTLSFATAVEKLESLVKEIVEIDERAHKLGISKEEYALLNVGKKYLSNRSDSDLTAFVKELDREIKTMLFPGWWREVKMETEVEQTLCDTCFQKFAGDLNTKQLTSLSEELMNFIVRCNP